MYVRKEEEEEVGVVGEKVVLILSAAEEGEGRKSGGESSEQERPRGTRGRGSTPSPSSRPFSCPTRHFCCHVKNLNEALSSTGLKPHQVEFCDFFFHASLLRTLPTPLEKSS